MFSATPTSLFGDMERVLLVLDLDAKWWGARGGAGGGNRGFGPFGRHQCGSYVKAQSRVNTWQNVLFSMQKATKALVMEMDGKPALQAFSFSDCHG